jgi:hypothetical protein
MLTWNLLARMGVPALAFLLDTNELTASARFAAALTGDDFGLIKTKIMDGSGDHYRERLMDKMPNVQASFHAPSADDVTLELEAFEQRYGLPPDAVLIDNLGNQAGQYDNEWAILKALTLEYDALAKDTQSAIIACAHTTDLDSCEPAQRSKILGKVAQYPALILSVGFNPVTYEYKIAVVKNREGASDREANRPVLMTADPARMQLIDPLLTPPPPMPVFDRPAVIAGEIPGQDVWNF